MSAVTVAIVTRDYDKYSETFVRRHVARLFGGSTVLVMLVASMAPPRDKPFHVFRRGETKRKKDLKLAHCPFLDSIIRANEAKRDARQLLRFLKQAQVTHVLCEFGYVATEVAEVIAAAGLPVFSYFRGNDASKRLQDPDYVDALRRVFPRLSGIIAVSQYLLDNLAGAGLRHANSIVIPSGTDVDLLRPGGTAAGEILTVGRLVEKKDPLTAMRAFAKVARSHPDLRWTIVGSGPLGEQLSVLRERLELGDQVELAGALPHSKVVERMQRATVYFQAFRLAEDHDSEGMPSAIQEAMAAGRAIVTTAHAGIPEHLEHGISGLVYAEGDVDGLADGLEAVLSSQELRHRLGTAARCHAEKNLDYRILFGQLERFILEPGSAMPDPSRKPDKEATRCSD